jgi:hypothetical protein
MKKLNKLTANVANQDFLGLLQIKSETRFL